VHRPRGARRLHPLWLAAVAVALGACGLGAIPIPNATPTPCAGTCPPPMGPAGTPHTVHTSYFTFTYYDPWTVQSSDASGTQLVASTQFGDVTVVLQGARVASGTTPEQLLTRSSQQVLDPNQFSGIQDSGPIRGAEIGYVAGAGESYEAYSVQSNAPDIPVFIEIMASVNGAAGVTFVAVSPLDPNSPDPSIVPNQEYDHIVNSVQWH
jgi:hypothetical protein